MTGAGSGHQHEHWSIIIPTEYRLLSAGASIKLFVPNLAGHKAVPAATPEVRTNNGVQVAGGSTELRMLLVLSGRS